MSELSYIFNILLAFFTIASFMLAFVTLSNAYRLRNTLLSWKAGKLFGFPIFASIFLVFTLGIWLLAGQVGLAGYSGVLACYAVMAFNWMLSSYFMSMRFITDHGIVKNINDPSQTIPWSNVHDLVERKTSEGVAYSFFYLPSAGPSSTRHCIRVELIVPKLHLEAFRRIMEHKLGRRFKQSVVPEPGFKQIN
jgi:hypothetical protein